MDFTDADDSGASAAPEQDVFPSPEEADPETVERYNERWMRSHPRQASPAARSGDDEVTADMPFTAKGVDRDGTYYKAEFPWLYESARGARWDFDPIELRTLSQENAWVGMMIQTIAKEVAETSWTITAADDTRETDKRLSTHPDERAPIQKDLPDATAEDIYDSLRNPNPDHDWTDLVEMWMSDLLEIGSLTGTKAFDARAYGDDDTLRFDADELTPHGLQASAPEVWTKEYHDKSGLLTGYWQFDRRSTPGGTQSVSRGAAEAEHFGKDEVLWTDHSPKSNRRYGTPPTLLVGNTLQSIDLAQTQEQQYLSRGSIPSGAWVFEEYDRKELLEMKEEQMENVKGKPHKSLTFAGKGGNVRFEPMSMNFQELEFTERMKWYARIVAAAFQVPTAVVGVEPEKVNYNTFQGERANFETNTLGPYLQQLERVLNAQWVGKHWDGYRFEFTPGLSESTRGMIAERVRSGFESNLLTRNEARREAGYEPVDDEADGFKDEVVEGGEEGGVEDLLGGVSGATTTSGDGTVGKAEYEVGDGTVDLTPPEYMIEAAEAAADAGEDGLIPSDCGTGRGDDRRDQIRNDAVGPDVVDEMATYLTSHAEDVTADGHPRGWTDEEWGDCGNAQYAKWGGVGDGRAMEWAQRKSDAVAELRGEEPTYKDFRKADASERPLRNTDDAPTFSVQPSDVDALYTDIADDVQAVFDEVLSDAEIQDAIDELAADPDEVAKGAVDLLRRVKDIIAESDVAGRIADAIDEHTTEEMRETLDTAASQVDADVDPDPIVQALEERDVAFADDFANRMADDIRETVADGWEAGKNSDEIREDLQDKNEEFGDWQAERIARQELQIASGEAREQFAAEAGKVEVWMDSGDDRVRDAHAEMDGSWKVPGDSWIVEYDDRGVQKESVPGDSEPGIGCRCQTLLVDREDVDAADYGGENPPT